MPALASVYGMAQTAAYPVAYIQGNHASISAAGTTLTCAYLSGQNAGNTNFVGIYSQSTSVSTVTDTMGNTYSQIATATNGTEALFIYAATSIGGNFNQNNTVTVTFSGPNIGSVIITEYQGPKGSVLSTNSNTGTTSAGTFIADTTLSHPLLCFSLAAGDHTNVTPTSGGAPAITRVAIGDSVAAYIWQDELTNVFTVGGVTMTGNCGSTFAIILMAAYHN